MAKQVNQHETRPRNIAKLLFINLLGYETEFGQMECLTLISRATFVEKRIGYLGITNLFSEKSDILMMATHRIRIDFDATDPYLQGVAIQTFSQIATDDMARDLGPQIAELIGKGHSYISKKACLAGIRVIKRAPEHIPIFCQKLDKVMETKNHGLLLCALSLCREIILKDHAQRIFFEKYVPHLVSRLKSLISAQADEYTIHEVCDPFLQMALLDFFRVLLKDSEQVDRNLQSLLENLPQDTRIVKNTGNALLYECAKTIISLNVEPRVKSTAMEIVNRVMGYKDINSLYVSLGLLGHMGTELKQSNFEHHEIVLDALREKDTSIKSLAIKVLVILASQNNVESRIAVKRHRQRAAELPHRGRRRAHQRDHRADLPHHRSQRAEQALASRPDHQGAHSSRQVRERRQHLLSTAAHRGDA